MKNFNDPMWHGCTHDGTSLFFWTNFWIKTITNKNSFKFQETQIARKEKITKKKKKYRELWNAKKTTTTLIIIIQILCEMANFYLTLTITLHNSKQLNDNTHTISSLLFFLVNFVRKIVANSLHKYNHKQKHTIK